MSQQKTIASLLIGTLFAASVLSLLCPSMVSATVAHHNCDGAPAILMGGAATLAPLGCIFPHVAAFRSLIFVVPNALALLLVVALALLGAALFLTQHKKQLQLLLKQQFWRFKKYADNYSPPPRFYKLFEWLSRLEARDFASC